MAIKNKKILLTMNERMFEQLNDYKDEHNFDTVPEALRHMIVSCCDKPAYIRVQEDRLKNKENLSPEERELKKAEKDDLRAKAKEKVFLNGRTNLCHSLGGSVTEDGYCQYPRFQEEIGGVYTEWLDRVPLESLPDDSHLYQYLSVFTKNPAEAKERVMKLIKAKKK